MEQLEATYDPGLHELQGAHRPLELSLYVRPLAPHVPMQLVPCKYNGEATGVAEVDGFRHDRQLVANGPVQSRQVGSHSPHVYDVVF